MSYMHYVRGMNFSRLTSTLTVLGFLAATLVAMTSPASATGQSASPTRIMALGDSVTRARAEDYSWRYFAQKGLAVTGADVDFVGPNGVEPHADMGFDQNNASWWGFSVWQLADHGWWPNEPRIADLVTEHDPDVIVEILGINDLTWVNAGPEGISGQLTDVIAEARSAKPDVDIVLGTLGQTWIRNVNEFNALLPGMAARLSTPESRIVVTPSAAWTKDEDTYDGLHPSTTGEIKLAKAVSVALEELGIGTAIEMTAPRVDVPMTPPIVIAPVPVIVPEPEPEPETVGVTPPMAPPLTVPEPVAEPVVAPAATPAVAAAPVRPSLVARLLRKGRVRLSWAAHPGTTRLWIRDVTAGRAWKPLAELNTATTRYVVRLPLGHRVKLRAAAVTDAGASPYATLTVGLR